MANTDQAKGAIDKVVGKAKEKIGQVTDNEKLEAEGLAQQAKGTVQKGVGDLKDKI